MKRIEPSWLTATIHQPSWRGRQQGSQVPEISTIARWPETRKRAQPVDVGCPSSLAYLAELLPPSDNELSASGTKRSEGQPTSTDELTDFGWRGGRRVSLVLTVP